MNEILTLSVLLGLGFLVTGLGRPQDTITTIDPGFWTFLVPLTLTGIG
jgi:hypothetical protein